MWGCAEVDREDGVRTNRQKSPNSGLEIYGKCVQHTRFRNPRRKRSAYLGGREAYRGGGVGTNPEPKPAKITYTIYGGMEVTKPKLKGRNRKIINHRGFNDANVGSSNPRGVHGGTSNLHPTKDCHTIDFPLRGHSIWPDWEQIGPDK